MATTQSRTFTEVKRDLARTITRHRDDCVPIEAARLLLAADRPEHELVGLRQDAERVIYATQNPARAYACPFGDSGPDSDRARSIPLPAAMPALDRWTATIDGYWGWLHPRYR